MACRYWGVYCSFGIRRSASTLQSDLKRISPDGVNNGTMKAVDLKTYEPFKKPSLYLRYKNTTLFSHTINPEMRCNFENDTKSFYELTPVYDLTD